MVLHLLCPEGIQTEEVSWLLEEGVVLTAAPLPWGHTQQGGCEVILAGYTAQLGTPSAALARTHWVGFVVSTASCTAPPGACSAKCTSLLEG